MKRFFSDTCLFILLLSPVSAVAQPMPADDNALSKRFSFIQPVYNRVQNIGGLDSFYGKLHSIKSGDSNVISIVHIGDSHIQADFLTAVVRKGLQDFFGNAGRGLVFPYQLAQTNGPGDISSASNIRWQFNRLAHPEIPINYGIAGHGIVTTLPEINMRIGLAADSFTRLKLFTGPQPWMLKTVGADSLLMLKNEEHEAPLYHEVNLNQPASELFLSRLPDEDKTEFYGVSLEKNKAGIIYHTIGVNGARYDHYNKASRFWEQLPSLNADLFIISLGTNEAQFARFSGSSFTRELTLFIEKLRQASPEASILITTAADSYKKRRLNPVLRQLNTALAAYCSQHRIPFWDLYRITNGYGSAYSWAKRGLMHRDRVHFTSEGYKIQGGLLLIALAKGYNEAMLNTK